MKKRLIFIVLPIAGLLMPLVLITAAVFGGIFVIGSAASMSLMSQSYCTTGSGSMPKSVPEPMNAIFTKAANHYNVPPRVLAAVYYIENGQTYREPPPPYGNGAAWPTSPANAHGPFQFIPGTWSMYGRSTPTGEMGNVNDLTDAAYAAAHYLANLGATNNAPLGSASNRGQKPSVINALARYNAGESPSNWYNSETNKYLAIAERELSPYYADKQSIDASESKQKNKDEDEEDAAIELNGACAVGPAEAQKGYPSTAKMQCKAGKDAGIAQTAKGNRIRLCNVEGTIVNASVAAQVQAIYNEMSARGFNISAYGFRTKQTTIDLRRAHCGTSQYAIWEMPSGQCSPPTATPGNSRHEQGDAIDAQGFYSHSQPIFQAMSQVAPKYGFCNLPSEPWHWDVTQCR